MRLGKYKFERDQNGHLCQLPKFLMYPNSTCPPRKSLKKAKFADWAVFNNCFQGYK